MALINKHDMDKYHIKITQQKIRNKYTGYITFQSKKNT